MNTSSLVDYPTSDQIEPDEARRLFKQCAFLIVDDLPTGSEFGIDLVVHRVGDKFKGVKLIPPGLHFVYASAINSKSLNHGESLSTSNYGPRCGFYHQFKSKELLIKKWSVRDEEFDQGYTASGEQYESYRANLQEMDRYLGCYSYSSYRNYLNLTNKINLEIVTNLMPTCKLIRSVPWLTDTSSDEGSSTSKSGRLKRRTLDSSGINLTKEEDLLPNFKPDINTAIKFTKIPENHHESKKKIPNELITKYNLDTSLKLTDTFGTDELSLDRLLGELQFAFVTFLLCHVYDCFEQWKTLVKLISGTCDAIVIYPKFFVQFCHILSYQVDQIPEDMFVDIVDTENLLRTILDNFFMNVTDFNQEVSRDLQEASEKLKNHLKKRFNWEFDKIQCDEQPVVVETD